MEASLDQLSTSKREVSQLCAAVQRSTSLDGMGPPPSVPVLHYVSNGNSNNQERVSPSVLPIQPVVPVNNSVPTAPQPCLVQRSRSLPLLDCNQEPLNTDDILAELAERANVANPGGQSVVSDPMDSLTVEQTLGHRRGSMNETGSNSSGSIQDGRGGVHQQDYSSTPSTPTTPHHIQVPVNSLTPQELSPSSHTQQMTLQPLNLSQTSENKLLSHAYHNSLQGGIALPLQQIGRDFITSQTTTSSWQPSFSEPTRFTFRGAESFPGYPSLGLGSISQGRNSPFNQTYTSVKEGDKLPQSVSDMYNSLTTIENSRFGGLTQTLGVPIPRSLMQLQQPSYRGGFGREGEGSLIPEDSVRVMPNFVVDPSENNNIKMTANMQAFSEAVCSGLIDKYPLSVNVSVPNSEPGQGSPASMSQKSNSPALRYKPMQDQMLSMINNYNEDQLLSANSPLMTNSPMMMDENFLTSAMGSSAISRLQEAANLPSMDSNSPTVNTETFDLLGGNNEESAYMSATISPQPQLTMEQQSDHVGGMMTLAGHHSLDSRGVRVTSSPRGNTHPQGNNNNAPPPGANLSDSPPKPRKGRPRAGGPPGHRYSQPCPTCGKVFGSSSALAKHKLIHSSERRHKCVLCAKSFKRQDHLTGHMLTHRSRKPYECTVDNCGKSYCDIRSLRRHFESQHVGLVMEDNMKYTGDEKDPELMAAEAAAMARQQAQSQNFANATSPPQQDFSSMIDYAPPTSSSSSSEENNSSSSAALQFLAQAAQSQRANTNTLSTLASVAEGHGSGNLLNKSDSNLPPHLSQGVNAARDSITGQLLRGTYQQLQQTDRLGSGNSNLSLEVSAGGLSIPNPKLTDGIVPVSIGSFMPDVSAYNQQTQTAMVSPPQRSSASQKRTEKERTVVTCSVCSRTFKSMPALNGHMRLHGGYNNARSGTPPTSNPDPSKGGVRHSQTNSQVPSSYPPSNDLNFASPPTAYHQITQQMVMPPHNVQLPPPQQAVNSQNMLSLMASRYNGPDNLYRTNLPLPGGGHQMMPGPSNLPPHLIGPGSLQDNLQRTIAMDGLYNMPRTTPPPANLPHRQGLSNLTNSVASIKTEYDPEHLIDPGQASVRALNLSTPFKREKSPSPPLLEKPTEREHPGLRVDTEKDLFRNPPPFQSSPTKKKPRPPSLVIPAWATTGNPGGIMHTAFQSQMRSPREVCTTSYFYRGNSLSTTPPPYTPPPMLSPIRSGSGLWFSAGSARPPRLSGSSLPSTPSMLQMHRRGSFTEETELVFSSEPHINIGSEFQAEIPDLIDGPCTEEASHSTLVWSFKTNKAYPEVEIKYFLELSRTPTLPGGARNIEFAYHCLHRAEGDIEVALMMLLNQKPLVPKNATLSEYRYDFSVPWSQLERKAFRDMYKAKGKDFHEIQKGIPTKTVQDCVEYYYFWKKLYPYNADMQKFCHHNKQTNPNEESRRNECDLYPDETFLDYVPLKEYRIDKYYRGDELSNGKTTGKSTTEKTAKSSDGPFFCSFSNCGASFKSKQALNGHIRVHGGLPKGDKVQAAVHTKGLNKTNNGVKSGGTSHGSSDSSAEDTSQDSSGAEDGEEEEEGEAMSSDESSGVNEAPKYPCKICGKIFNKVSSRSAHMKSHKQDERRDFTFESTVTDPPPPMSPDPDPTSYLRPSVSSHSDGEDQMDWESNASSDNEYVDESGSSGEGEEGISD